MANSTVQLLHRLQERIWQCTQGIIVENSKIIWNTSEDMNSYDSILLKLGMHCHFRNDKISVNSGVRQWYILSPFLFLIVIDWILRQTTHDKKRSIKWIMFSHLEDLDFFPSHETSPIYKVADKLNIFSKHTRLNIRPKQWQSMHQQNLSF